MRIPTKTLFLIVMLRAVVFAQGESKFTIFPKRSGVTGTLEFQEITGGNYVGLRAPSSITTNRIYTLPAADGTNGYCLKTNGSGVLSFGVCGGGGAVTAPLVLESDSSPQLQIQGETNTNLQLLLGYEVGAGRSTIQSVHQGTAFTQLALNPSGGGVSIATPGASGIQLRVNGRTDSNGLCVRSATNAPGWCLENNDVGFAEEIRIRHDTAGDVLFTGYTGDPLLRFNKSLIPFTNQTVGTTAEPWDLVAATLAVIRSTTTEQKQVVIDYDLTANAGRIQSVHQGTGLTPLYLQASGGGVVVHGTGTAVSGQAILANGVAKTRGLNIIDGSGTLTGNTSGAFLGIESSNTRVTLRKNSEAGDELIRFETSSGLASIARIAGDVSPFTTGGTLGNSTPWANVRAATVTATTFLPAGSASIGDIFAPFENVRANNGYFAALEPNLIRMAGQFVFTADGIYNIGGSTVRPNNVYAYQFNAKPGFTSTLGGRVNFGGAIGAPNGFDGVSATISVRNAADTGSCSLVFSAGLLTSSTC
jgi:hypothetical protein